MENTKQIGKYDISIFESIGRFKVKVEDIDEDVDGVGTFVAEYEAKENFNNLDTEEDCRIFIQECNGK